MSILWLSDFELWESWAPEWSGYGLEWLSWMSSWFWALFSCSSSFHFFFFIFHQFQFNVFIFSPFSSQTSCICMMIITLLPYIGGMARFPCHNPTQKRIPDRLWRIRSLIVDSRSFIGGFTDLLRRANTLTASSISSRTYINHQGPTTCTLFMTPSQLANFSAWRHSCSERYCPFVDPVVRWMDLLADPPSPGDKAQRK